jgi:hypothetical protein
MAREATRRKAGPARPIDRLRHGYLVHALSPDTMANPKDVVDAVWQCAAQLRGQGIPSNLVSACLHYVADLIDEPTKRKRGRPQAAHDQNLFRLLREMALYKTEREATRARPNWMELARHLHNNRSERFGASVEAIHKAITRAMPKLARFMDPKLSGVEAVSRLLGERPARKNRDS